jgi:hypothetical protein
MKYTKQIKGSKLKAGLLETAHNPVVGCIVEGSIRFYKRPLWHILWILFQ